MKNLLTAIVFFGVCLAFPLSVRAENMTENSGAYLSVMPDIPLMQGLYEDKSQSVIFDKEDGKVAETVLFGEKTTSQDIKAYYDEVLAQLGWKAQKTGIFVRNDEQLLVNIEKVGAGGRVVLSLSPKMP